jgi:dolichyl-phosphate beta-glucosyltransferase
MLEGENILRIDLIIPAYNEAQRIEPTLRSYAEALKEQDCHILVVDDGSSDGTAGVVNDLAAELPVTVTAVSMPANAGKGAAVKYGFERCREDLDIVFFADADGSTPAEEFAPLIKAFEAGFDVGVASRGIGDIQRSQTWIRDRMGKTFNFILKCLLPINISDTQCGFKYFKPEVVKLILEKSALTGFAFDVEFLIIAQSNGYKIKEIPVTWHHVDESRVHIIFDSLRMLRDVLRINWNRLLGRYRK